jgi:hypothetical protein
LSYKAAITILSKYFMRLVQPGHLPPPLTEATGLTAVATTKMESLIERYTGFFPVLVANFNQNWDAWQKTWTDPANSIIQSSDGFAQGPEWDALVAMGIAILPQVVAKLQSPTNIFGCDLCMCSLPSLRICL